MTMENPTLHKDAGTARAVDASEPIFAMDIGTRSIIGVVGIPEDNILKVLAIERMDHPQRAMIDGQIEDIDLVAKVANSVKQQLEQKLGFSLNNVYVAAAGRALKTQKAAYEAALDPKEPIREQQVFDLEMCAIQEARAAVGDLEEGDGAELYCVGHSVVRYTLDDYPISTLLGHRGKRAKVEIIATFLPSEVVESLYAAMNKIGLTVAGLTLEPIAAMNAIIPKELRMLNLALVDIGAGTSDIAVSEGGSVTAYTMATVAGDEITDAIVRNFLVDFETAERMKLDLGRQPDRIEYRDILGFTYSVAPAQIMEKVQAAAESLSDVIGQKILEVNEKAPAAVFLVGGGSQFPGLCKRVAEKLGIEESKAAVGGNNYMKKTVISAQDISSPEYATPMGIAITAMNTRSHGSLSVMLNGKQVRVFKNGPMTVMDILRTNGYRHHQMIGRAGKSVTFTLNGDKKTVRGGFPVAAAISVNGRQASISTPIAAGDVVNVEDAVPGADASPMVKEVVENWAQFEVFLNGARIPAGTTAQINEIPAGGEQRINNMDDVRVIGVETLEDLCHEAKLSTESYCFLVNGCEQGGGYRLCPQDDIRYFPAVVSAPQTEAEPAPPAVQEPRAAQAGAAAGKEAAPPGNPLHITLNGRQAELSPKEDGTPYLFVDMLNFVDIDPSKPQGNIVLQINGREASYMETVKTGDQVEIYWDGTQGSIVTH